MLAAQFVNPIYFDYIFVVRFMEINQTNSLDRGRGQGSILIEIA